MSETTSMPQTAVETEPQVCVNTEPSCGMVKEDPELKCETVANMGCNCEAADDKVVEKEE